MSSRAHSSIQIWSPDHAGHHLLYAKFIAQHAAERKVPVTIYLTHEGLLSDEFRLHLAALDITTKAVGSVRSALASVPEDGLLVICHVDRIMTEILRAKVPKRAHVAVLVMRPSRTMDGKRKRLAKALMTRSIHARRRIRIAELGMIGDHAGRAIPLAPDPVVRTGEPIPEDHARELLGLTIPKDCKLGLAIGLLTARKRPDLLVGALAHLPDRHHMLFAGHQDAQFKRVVDGARDRFPGRIHILNEHLSDADFGLCINAANYVAALHPTGISSGVVLQAIALGRPVIVCAGTPLARVVEHRQLGAATLSAPEDVAAAIRTIFNREMTPQSISLPTVTDFVTSLLGEH